MNLNYTVFVYTINDLVQIGSHNERRRTER